MSEPVIDIRTFLGGMNSDDDDTIIPKQDYRSARNCNIGYSDDENAGTVENVKGTWKINYRRLYPFTDTVYSSALILPEGKNKEIGSCFDAKRRQVIWMVYNSNEDHCICAYNIQDQVVTFILEKEPLLGFRPEKQYRINFINVIGDLLMWTDNNMPPSQLNILRAIRYTEQKNSADPMLRPFPFIGTVNPKTFVSTISDKNMAILLDDPDGEYYAFYIKYFTNENKDKYHIFIRFNNPQRWEHNGECKLIYCFHPLIALDKTLLVFDRKRFLNETGSGTIYQYNGMDQYYGITRQTLDQIQYQPDKVATVSYDQDKSQKNNFMRGLLSKFIYRFLYLDDEYSCWNEHSQVVYPEGDQLLNGHFHADTSINNRLNVWHKTGTELVKRIEIAIAHAEDGKWQLVDRIDKFDDEGNLLLPSFVEHPYYFKNDIVGEGMDQKDQARLFDNVPLKCGVQELISNNRLVAANVLEGYDNVTPDLRMELFFNNVQLPVVLDPITACSHWVCSYPMVFFEHGKRAYFNYNYEPSFGFKNTVWVIEYVIFYDSLGLGFNNDWDPTPPPGAELFYYRVFVYPEDTDTIVEITDKIFQQTEGSFKKRIKCYHGVNTKYPCLTTLDNEIKYVIVHNNWVFYKVTGKVYQISPSFKSHKANSMVYGGIVYYDESGRSGGVNKNDEAKIYIPNLSSFTPFYPNTLYDPAANEKMNCYKQVEIRTSIYHKPPLWAKYYQFFTAKNKSPFVYALASKFYIENGKVYFNVNFFLDSIYEENHACIIKPYEWKKGDRIRFLAVKPRYYTIKQFYLWYQNLDFEILGEFYNEVEDSYKQYFDGEYVIDAVGNRVYKASEQRLYVDDFNPAQYNIQLVSDEPPLNYRDECHVIVELYHPDLPLSDDEGQLIYRATGKFYEIGDAGLPTRYHKGQFSNQTYDPNGETLLPAVSKLDCEDIFLRLRIWLNGGMEFPVEDYNYSDFYVSDFVNRGRVNKYLRDAEQKRYGGKLQFGGAFLEGTKINDLFRMDAMDSYYLTEKWLPITGFKELGYTLKVLQGQKTTSIYIGKVGLMQAGNQGEIRATTSNIFGDINVSESQYGCMHPESIVQVGRSVCFYDFFNGCFVRDFANGPIDIAKETKYANYFRRLTEQIKQYGYENVYVISTVDYKYDRIFVHVAVDINEIFTHIETLCYSLRRNRWVSKFDFKNSLGQAIEHTTSAENILIGFLDGMPYLQENVEDARGMFFGGEYDQQLEVVFNENSAEEKQWAGVSVNSNKIWSAPGNNDITIPASSTAPRGMCSRLIAAKFRKQEGSWYAAFMRNMLSSSSVAQEKDLVTGDFLQGQTIKMRLINSHRDKTNLLYVSTHGLIG